MNTRLPASTAAALLAAVLASGCNTQPPTPEQAERRCQSWRNYMPTRTYDDVMQECTLEMGAAACTKCMGAP